MRFVAISNTHSPPHKVLDLVKRSKRVGCPFLREHIIAINRKVHVCGHIHESYGVSSLEGTLVMNASISDLGYDPCQKTLVFDWKPKGQVVVSSSLSSKYYC